jgi:hypothetical protein
VVDGFRSRSGRIPPLWALSSRTANTARAITTVVLGQGLALIGCVDGLG